jgi:hypothetical protein
MNLKLRTILKLSASELRRPPSLALTGDRVRGRKTPQLWKPSFNLAST